MIRSFSTGFWKGLSWPITWPLGWGCYWLGDGVARVLNLMPETWPEWPGRVLYRLYDRLMQASLWLSDTFGLGIWMPADTSSGVGP